MPPPIQLEYAPRDQFVQFHMRKQRWACMICHRRAGKTTACLMDLLDHAARTPGGRYAYIAPLRNQAKTVAWDMLKAFARPVLRGNGPNEAELRVDLVNGSRITLFGADNPDALRGQAFNGVVLDEYADMPPTLYSVIVRPALADRRGFAVIIGTIKGRNQLWATYELAKINPDWYTAYLKASETRILPEDELEDAKRQMSEEQFASEFECDPYAAIMGAYYAHQMSRAEREGRVLEPQQVQDFVEPSTAVHTAWDLGMGDSTAIWFWQAVGSEIRVIDYYESHGKGLDHYASVLAMRGYRYGKDFVPHDAKVRELGTGKTRVETLVSLGRNPTLIPGHNLIDGINATRVIFPKCSFDAKKCETGLEALRQYRADYDDIKKVFKETPRHDWTSHPADAFRYLAMAYRTMRPPEEEVQPRGVFITLPELSYDQYAETGDKKEERV